MYKSQEELFNLLSGAFNVKLRLINKKNRHMELFKNKQMVQSQKSNTIRNGQWHYQDRYNQSRFIFKRPSKKRK